MYYLFLYYSHKISMRLLTQNICKRFIINLYPLVYLLKILLY